MDNFTSGIKSELPQQTYLELATWYHRLHCDTEALKVLALAPQNAEIIYWKAFLENKPVDVSTIQTGTDFPFRAETAAVLEALIQHNGQWLLKYHLGLIEWNRNNLEKARALFAQCGNEPTDANFYAARASLNKENGQQAEADLQRALTMAPQQWRFHKLLGEYYLLHKDNEKALAISEPYYKSHPADYVMGMLTARALLLNKKYQQADALLTKIKILPFEGGTEGRRLYHEAKLMQAVAAIKDKQYKKALPLIAAAKLWPDNLGVGKPYQEEIDERLENWFNYICYSNLHQEAQATAALQSIIAFTPKVDNTVLNFLPANALVSAWAIEKTESAEKAADWLQQQAKLFPANKIIQWALAVYGKQPPALTDDQKSGEVRVLEQL
jgi:hypothetical protein